jgi:hypothetical protein
MFLRFSKRAGVLWGSGKQKQCWLISSSRAAALVTRSSKSTSPTSNPHVFDRRWIWSRLAEVIERNANRIAPPDAVLAQLAARVRNPFRFGSRRGERRLP